MRKLLSGLLAVVLLLVATLAIGCTSNDKAQLASQDNTQLQQAQSQLTQASSQLTQAQTELSALKTTNDAAQKKIAELMAAPPARYFASTVELANWLALDKVSEEPAANTYVGWYNKALKVQQNAARDGFIISVQYHYCDERQVIEYIACLTVVHGYLFKWDPESDDVVEDPYWDKIQ
jgi:small-conductance mechanosensitive channel